MLQACDHLAHFPDLKRLLLTRVVDFTHDARDSMLSLAAINSRFHAAPPKHRFAQR
jgi:hypothetical protein